jgi:NAD(P)-dependent dehydrogenase (short-subunit alcohol dehydrogenase family)
MSEKPWAVVLGVSSGTGAAIARALAKDPGLNVFGVHRGNYPKEAETLHQDLLAQDRRGLFCVADAGTTEAPGLLVPALEQAAGKQSVTVFVHSLANASIGKLVTGNEPRLVPKQIDKTMTSMANSFVYWVQELVRRDLLAPGARLIGLTNVMDESLVEGCVAIAAAKAALEVYVRQLAIELGPLGHRVNLLKFSAVITAALRRVFGNEGAELVAKLHADLNPAGRVCTVEEVGDFVSVLAGPKTAWMNGATIDFMGGASLRWADVIVRYHRELSKATSPTG